MWTNRPVEQWGPEHLRIVRAPENRPLRGIVLSHDLEGAYTHYIHGRTRPCQGEHCGPCVDGQRPRWYGFLHLLNADSGRQAIAELTPNCLEAINAYLARAKSLRGAELILSRVQPRRNAPLQAVLKLAKHSLEELPPAVDLRAHLRRIWEITDGSPADEVIRPTMPRRIQTYQKTTEGPNGQRNANGAHTTP